MADAFVYIYWLVIKKKIASLHQNLFRDQTVPCAKFYFAYFKDFVNFQDIFNSATRENHGICKYQHSAEELMKY